jgi:hypothetical protein
MKAIKILIASLLLSTAVMAQKTVEERATAQTEKLATELSLTADQKEKVKQINLGIIQKNEGVRTSTMTQEEKKKAIKMNEEARDEMFKGVMTVDQFKAYKMKKTEFKTIKKPVQKDEMKPEKAVPSKN